MIIAAPGRGVIPILVQQRMNLKLSEGIFQSYNYWARPTIKLVLLVHIHRTIIKFTHALKMLM